MDNINKFEDFLDRMQGLLDKAKKQGHIIVRVEDLENTFPELKGNEYESTRKRIIALVNAHGQGRFKESMLAWLVKLKVFAENGDGLYYFANSGFTYVGNPTWDNVSFLENQEQKKSIDDLTQQEAMDIAIAKCFEQGEQKLAEKVEPKFQNGQWIVWQNKCYKVNYNGYGYELIDQNGLRTSLEYGTVDENAHLWTIEDAKPGDVLIDKSGSREGPFIFKETKPSDIKTNMLNPLTVLGYCGIGGAGFTKGIGWGDTANCIYYPATKEQRELLFKRMHEAGYEWNADKKELKKINSYCQEHCKGYQETGKCFVDGGCNAKREAEKIENTSPLLSDFFNAEYERGKADALKSVEWSEEDESMCQETIDWFEKKCFPCALEHENPARESIKWLKSLKQRHTWKPTEEQIEALERCVDYLNESDNEDAGVIDSLCHGLKLL